MAKPWSSLIYQAEKLLGGPAPFINLSSLLTSEAGFLASRARRLAASVNHPFFSTVRACLRGRSVQHLFSVPSNMPALTSNSERPSGGLLILLVGQSYKEASMTSTKLFNQQRTLAEIFETVHTAVALHKSLVNLNHIDESNETWFKDMETGNKLATLAGDVLLASVSSSLAKLHHAQVVDIISEAIGDMTEAEFSPIVLNFKPRHSHFSNDEISQQDQKASELDSLSTPLPSFSPLINDWLSYVTLSRGSLLGSCCYSSLLVVQAHLDNKSACNEFTQPYLANLFLASKQFGSNWACLMRLIEERENMKQMMMNNADFNSKCHSSYFSSQNSLSTDENIGSFHHNLIPHYFESGLIEPTFADYFLTKFQISRPVMINELIHSIISEYNSIGFELSNRLRQSFNQLLSNAVKISGEQARKPPSVEILETMVDQLINESVTS